MSDKDMELKAVVTVAEMARMIGLSRARFYQLQRDGVFPMPCYSVRSRRPLYTEEQQTVVLEARRRNMGINGRPVLFYCPRSEAPQRPIRRPRMAVEQRRGNPANQSVLDAVKSIGLSAVTLRDVDAAIVALYPSGTANVAEGEVVRAVFLHLRRQNSGDNVGR